MDSNLDAQKTQDTINKNTRMIQERHHIICVTTKKEEFGLMTNDVYMGYMVMTQI